MKNYQKPRNIRELLIRLLMGCGDIDDNLMVKIVKRDGDNVVTEVAYVPISYIDSHDNICVECHDIKFETYH